MALPDRQVFTAIVYVLASGCAWLRSRGIAVRIARKGTETGDKLGRHRWVIERTLAWLTGYRRLTLRYVRQTLRGIPVSPSYASYSCTSDAPGSDHRPESTGAL